ncbi:hypothetical protein GQ55_1G365900 [Panicum hallii var. hallii]|uniref:Uncharacterized protein n=1 Tax=Panicum hallii var. hallii TaxID=1504633 RepID=A0A2T7FBB1_9POAL|nr:hypothetical protein GQ55_1G365900 [Panicum hallii var. hallii]PUZ77370.1 hypothetical protein GQ55_1G365900 [Panicum hallii var. hallii]
MALAQLSRRLLSPTAAAAAHLPKAFPYRRDPFVLLHPGRRFFSASASANPSPDSSSASSEPNTGAASAPASPNEMRHQEIEGPTVERDTSPLADETRRELDALRRTVQGLSGSLALLGGAHLAAGAWIAYGAPPLGVESAAAVQGVAAFAFPFTVALVLRRAIKPIAFFQKMEANARLQVLTLCLQATKNVNLMLLRTRVMAISCALGVSVASVAAILMR